MNGKLNRAVWAACLIWAIAGQASAADARAVLTRENLRKAEVHYLKKWNVQAIVDGGVPLRLETGEIASHRGIQMLVDYLTERDRIPRLEELEPLVEDKSDALRFFSAACLRVRIPDLPFYSPFFPPGSEPESVSKVLAAIEKAKEGEMTNPPR